MEKMTAGELASIVEALGEPVLVYDENLKIAYCNPAASELIGLSPKEAAGRYCYEVIPGKYCHTENCTAVRAKKEGRIVVEADKHIVKTDRWIPTRITAAPIKDAKGNVTGIVEVVSDLSELRTLRERDEMIRKMSTPLVEVWEGVVMLPLIGILDTVRAKQITESVLQRIAQVKTEIIIMDISGIAAMDTKTASHFLRTTQAVKLMGSDIIITGIRPEIATTLVTLGVDLSGIVTRSTLREGLEYAYTKAGFKVTKSSTT